MISGKIFFIYGFVKDTVFNTVSVNLLNKVIIFEKGLRLAIRGSYIVG